jgi:hypothetical protein
MRTLASATNTIITNAAIEPFSLCSRSTPIASVNTAAPTVAPQ